MHQNHFLKNLVTVGVSVLLAFLLVKFGIVQELLDFSKDFIFLGAILAGVFFVSIFTTAPAIAFILELSHEMPIFELVVLGGIGALLGDLIIFHFLKERLTDDVNLMIEKIQNQGFFSIFKSKYFRWLAAVLGAFVIASPLPDELGIAIIGVSKLKTAAFVPLSFIFNSLGILIIALLGKM